jgi:transcriptional regulator with XRE-family HTH domain
MHPIRRRPSKTRWPAAYLAFTRRLIAAREEAGLTQREAALRLRRSQSFVAKSETGERRVDIVELLAFARAYDRAPDYFFANITKTPEPATE